jgi:signal transduction histidine kinase
MHPDITIVFFIYGLAFFSMGLVMLLEANRSPLLAGSTALFLLAIFGIFHGSHEWIEMAIENNTTFQSQFTEQISWFRLFILAISFTSLLVFSLLVLGNEKSFVHQKVLIGTCIIGLYSLIVIIAKIMSLNSHQDWLLHVDSLMRYLLAVPAASLAGAAFIIQAKQAKSNHNHKLSLAFWIVSIAFIIYAITQTVVPPLDTFPANIWNSHTFYDLTGIPIQVIRAVTAIAVMLGLLRASQLVENKRKSQFAAAQQTRQEALLNAKKAMEEREALQEELIRHTIITQEEERARIARELHDETSQVLTAISFHLESLRSKYPDNTVLINEVDYLQKIRREMAESIFRMINDLRPSLLDDLGLVAAINYLIEQENKLHNLQVQLNVLGQADRLDPLVETALYRITQEALTNISRHAGVHEANIVLSYDREKVILQISDKGHGFNVAQKQSLPDHWGLEGMRERANAVDGELSIRSTPGKGTTVEVYIPLKKPGRN